MAGVKPNVGDLVKLNLSTQTSLTHVGPLSDITGLVIQCIGIRCRVRWSSGIVTIPERAVLEVLSAAR